MDLTNLADKVKRSKEVLQEALIRFPNRIALAWTGGKDSTTTLHLLRELSGGQVTIPVLNIDTSVKFKEIYEFRDRLAKEWNLHLIIERNNDALKTIKIAENKEECCLRLKVEVIAQAITKYGWQALITGMRWDEQPDRAREEYFSPRQNPDHMRVHPILHFSELDIRNKIMSQAAIHYNLTKWLDAVLPHGSLVALHKMRSAALMPRCFIHKDLLIYNNLQDSLTQRKIMRFIIEKKADFLLTPFPVPEEILRLFGSYLGEKFAGPHQFLEATRNPWNVSQGRQYALFRIISKQK